MASEIPASNEPRLGLATTRQLLEELESRGRVDHVHTGSSAALALGLHADALMKTLPEKLLRYRTVDED